MPEIKVACVGCGQRIQLDESYCGQQIGCPQCQTAFIVPPMSPVIPEPPVIQQTYRYNPNARKGVTLTLFIAAMATGVAGLFWLGLAVLQLVASEHKQFGIYNLVAALCAFYAATELLKRNLRGFQLSLFFNMANLCLGTFQALTDAPLLWAVVPFHFIGLITTWFSKNTLSAADHGQLQTYIAVNLEQFLGTHKRPMWLVWVIVGSAAALLIFIVWIVHKDLLTD